ncbi:MAG: DEAD/DEAH box helicase family protein [Pseudomonadales bacterium]|nr:DEAD/DEAH box helicase family protein [Pseudomonadales bacterium]
MKLQFDADQQYQLDAIKAVVDLFDGQPGADQGVSSFDVASHTSLALTENGIANNRVLSDEQWLQNLHTVQQDNFIPPSESLESLVLEDGTQLADFPNFTVEMETGTGKTYVYLRSILELHQRYGFSKFVIVVPSIAIREGVLKSLQITHEHFNTLYDYTRLEHTVYDGSRASQLRNFALSDALQILVINIDAFAKDSDENSNSRRRGNIINQVRETGVAPIEFIQATNPIVILDEPQNLETDKRKRAIARLNPLCTLRYSATHKQHYNLIYKLDPVKAYELGLVKQISVDSVIDLSSNNQAYIEVESFTRGTRSISAKALLWINERAGPKKKRVTLKNGANLYELSKQREIYKDGFIVNEIDAEQGFVRFANDVVARVGVAHGALTETILKLQIEATIRRHFEKAIKLEAQGVKVLSVFFIDRVSSYRVYHDDGATTLGPFGQWFEALYEEYRNKPEFAGLYDRDAAQVHNGYFAQDKQAVSPYGEMKLKTKGEAETGAFELIMRDKERLLDQAEPLRFIFSHSALREGWDNPNVFQICTLAESASEIRKRQELGRGLRICVNQAGDRVFDRHINRLTVVANESYEDFARQLQTELEEDGLEFRKELVRNEREKVQVRLRKGYETDSRFLELWERIRQRTRYRVHYDSAALIQQSAARIAEDLPPIEKPKIALSRASLDLKYTGVEARQTGLRTETVEANFVIPDLVAQVQNATGLGRHTIAEILLQSNRLADALNNPQSYIDQCASLINSVKRELLVAGVEYLRVDDVVYEMRRFEDDDLNEVFSSNVREVAPEYETKTLFSHIVIDSNSSPERQFAEDCEQNDDVLFYIKLPNWFTIDTPVGNYNPDWAVAYRNQQAIYFVAETKGTGSSEDPGHDLLRPLEKLKIDCAKRHFEDFEEVTYRVVANLQELVG